MHHFFRFGFNTLLLCLLSIVVLLLMSSCTASKNVVDRSSGPDEDFFQGNWTVQIPGRESLSLTLVFEGDTLRERLFGYYSADQTCPILVGTVHVVNSSASGVTISVSPTYRRNTPSGPMYLTPSMAPWTARIVREAPGLFGGRRIRIYGYPVDSPDGCLVLKETQYGVCFKN